MANTKQTIQENKKVFDDLQESIAQVRLTLGKTDSVFLEFQKSVKKMTESSKDIKKANEETAKSVDKITDAVDKLRKARSELYRINPSDKKEWDEAYSKYTEERKKVETESNKKRALDAYEAIRDGDHLLRRPNETAEEYNKRRARVYGRKRTWEKNNPSGDYYAYQAMKLKAYQMTSPEMMEELIRNAEERDLFVKSRGFRGVKYRDWFLEEMMNKKDPRSYYSSMRNSEIRAAQDYFANGDIGGLVGMLGPNRTLGNIRAVNKQIIDQYRTNLYGFYGREADINDQMRKIEEDQKGAPMSPAKKEQYDKLAKELEVLKSNREDYEKNYGGAYRTARIKTAVSAGIQGVYNTTKKIVKGFGEILGITFDIKKFASDIFARAKQLMEEMPTYDTSNSLITNAEARNQQMKYGLSDTQNFAFTQAKNMLNIRSDEDLLYMNPNQQLAFSQYMQKYSAWYTELMDSGVLQDIQEFKLEFKMFKEELAMDVLKWFADNKETIMAILNMTFTVMKGLVSVLGGIAKFFGFSADFASTSTAVNNSSLVNSRNVNVNMTNNVTGVLGSEESMQNFFDEQQSKLAKTLNSTSY